MSLTTLPEYPRVLVVDGMPFSRTRNGGIVRSQLFAGWPKERLCQIMFDNGEPWFDVCERYWLISKTDVLLGTCGCAPGKMQCEITRSDTISEPGTVYENRPRVERLARWLSPQIRIPLSLGIFRLPALLSPPLCEWIDSFRPEVIFTFASSNVILRTAAVIATRSKVSVIPYFVDDWIRTAYRGYVLGPILRQNTRHWFDRCLAVSPIRLTPNEAMSREYGDRYGGRFEVMYYAEVVRPYSPPPSLPVVRFVFIGGMASNRWSSLKKIGQALDSLAEEGLRSELIVYAFPEDLNALVGQEIPRSVQLAGTAAPRDVARLQADANVLVHVESFDAISRAETRLSLSTKLPQYFMAGRCVLALGPAEGASIRYVSETGAGVAVTEDNLDAVRSALRIIISNESVRNSQGVTAYHTAIERNDEARQQCRFRTLLCAAARPEPGMQRSTFTTPQR